MNTLKGPVSISIGIGLLGAATSWALWKYYLKKEKIPEKWRTVGKLVDMMCFPIKSGGVIRLNEMECTDLGLQSGLLRDRHFMIITETGTFVTARTHPKLVLIQPRVEGDHLILEAPDMENLKLNWKTDVDKKATVSLWGASLKCLDSGDEAAKWISRFALGKEKGFRIVYCPQDYKNMQKSRKKMITNFDSGAFTDLTSYHLINGGSMDELNSRLSHPIEALQFRPNFVVSGGQPYEEDYWEWVKIGDVVFKVLKQCNRCTLTLINPETGIKDVVNREPLATLNKYRMVGDPKLKVSDKTTPVMGIHLGLRLGGFVKIGDSVEVA